MSGRAFAISTVIGVTLLTMILVPFFLYEAEIVEITETFVNTNHIWWFTAVGLGTLLAADIFLPVPSSLVSTACGSALGFWGGMLVSWLGMTVGCVLGYILGVGAGRPTVRYLVGATEAMRVEQAAEHYGHWVIMLFRAVPVLAEVSVLVAGLSRMPVGRFLTIATLSNLGISAVYAGMGAFAADVESFLLAFAGAVLVPAITWWIVRGRSEPNMAIFAKPPEKVHSRD